MAEGKYRIVDVFQEDFLSKVHLSQDQTGRFFFLREFNPDRITSSELAKIRYAFKKVAKFENPGIIKHVETIDEGGHSYLVTEMFEGRPLLQLARELPLPLEKFLDIAISLAQTLGASHQNNVVHHGISRSCVFTDYSQVDVRLTHFASDAVCEVLLDAVHDANVKREFLPYLSPEQTGRMNRPVDYRSDFYSLGIFLFELLTGAPPFLSDDPLEIIHGHIARTIPHPSSINRNVPQVLGNLVLKLLSKNGQHRYQNGFGLAYDLELMAREFKETGKVETFELASRDVSSKFALPNVIIGREPQIRKIMEAFSGVVSGKSIAIFVSGYSGIGKSSIINEVQRPIAERQGYFLSTKYDQLTKTTPHNALLQTFRQLLKYILSQPRDTITRIRHELEGALGDNSGLIAEMLPEFKAMLLDNPPTLETGSNEAQNRLKYALRELLRVIASREHPIVIALDDVHWADYTSLDLVQFLILAPEVKHVLWIFSYRDNVVDNTHPLIQIIQNLKAEHMPVYQLEIPPLVESEIQVYASELLRCTPEKTEDLAKLLFKKTGGNPFFLGQFVLQLNSGGLFSFDRTSGWQWDLSRISEMKITDNVVDLVTDKIAMLDDSLRLALQFAACIGNRFLYTTLATTLNMPLDDVLDLLSIAVDEGLIGQGKEHYFFLHDRIQEVAYMQMPEAKRIRVHYRIAVILWARAGQDKLRESLFEIVNQFGLSRRYISSGAEKVEIAKLCLMAGEDAKAGNLYSTAINYLDTGLEILGPDSWARDHALCKSLHEQAATACYLARDFDKMRQHTDELLQRASSVVEKAKSSECLILAYQAQNRPIKGLKVAVETLGELGVAIPENPNWANITWLYVRLARRLKKMDEKTFLEMPPMTDPNMVAALKILGQMGLPAIFVSPVLRMFVALKRLEILLDHGRTSQIGSILSSFASLECIVTGKMDVGLRLGIMSLSLAEKIGDPESLMYTKLNFYATIEWWSRHVATSLDTILETARDAVRVGAFHVAAPMISIWELGALVAGRDLNALKKRMEENYTFLLQMRHETHLTYNLASRQMVQNLIDGPIGSQFLDGPLYDSEKMQAFFVETGSMLGAYMNDGWRTIIATIFGHHEKAVEYFHSADTRKVVAKALHLFTVVTFYSTLSFIKLSESKTGKERRRLLETAKKNLRKIKHWKHHAKSNHQHRYDLIKAELYRIEGHTSEATSHYEKSMRAALEQGFIHEAGLACEYAGSFMLSMENDIVAISYLQKARECYQKWGSFGKVRHLEEQYAQRIGMDKIGNSRAPFKQLDYMTVLQALQDVSGEIEIHKLLSKLINTLLNIAGADKVQFFVFREDGLFLEADLVLTGGRKERIESIPVSECETVFHSVVNLVSGSREAALLDNATRSGQYHGEPYVLENNVKSVLCLPVQRKSALIGIIYLENTVAEGAFTPDRIEALEMLASQAAISLENARLYDEIRQTFGSLVESQERLSLVLQGASLGMWDVSTETQKIVFNERYALLHGLGPDKLEADLSSIYKNLHEEDMERVARATKDHLDGSTPFFEMEYRVRTSDRGWRWVLSRGQIAESTEDGVPLRATGIAMDIDPRKQAEERRGLLENQVRQHQKMESMGQLAGGVAHDLNNLMTPILGYADLLKEDHRQDPTLCEDLDEIRYAGKRAQALIKQLLAFGRKQVLEWNVLDIDDVIVDFKRVLRRLIREDIEFEINLGAKGGHVRGDVSQLQQIFLNLVVNARDAMPKGGKLSIVSQDTLIDGNHSAVNEGLEPGRYIQISVADNGTGMDEETKNRIFEPFFTTKEIGKGTGLGLSTVYGIVKQHGGRIQIESEPGKGTRFTLFFPIIDSKDLPTVRFSSIPPGPLLGTETILLVEDDRGVRKFVSNVLDKRGYRILVANGGKEAIDIAKAYKSPIDLLLTDVVMPKMGGKEVYKELCICHPEMSVVYMSGYATEEFILDGIQDPQSSLISKPFTANRLDRKIREVLDFRNAVRKKDQVVSTPSSPDREAN